MDDLITKLTERLNAAGIHCAAAFSVGRLPMLKSPMVVVDCSTELSPAAIGGCFGRDINGRYYTCHAAAHTATLEIYAPYLGGGTAIGAVVRKLLLALQTAPEGYSLHSIQVGQVHYDADSDCFRCTLSVRLDSYLSLTEEEAQ